MHSSTSGRTWKSMEESGQQRSRKCNWNFNRFLKVRVTIWNHREPRAQGSLHLLIPSSPQASSGCTRGISEAGQESLDSIPGGSNQVWECKLRKQYLFTVHQDIKYLYMKNYNALLRETWEYLKEASILLRYQILPKMIYTFNVIPLKIPADCVVFRNWQTDDKIFMADLEYPKQFWKRTKWEDLHYLISGLTVKL